MGRVPKTRPAAANEFNSQYEALRSWALARPRPQCSPAGASVLLRYGLAAWLQAVPECVAQSLRPTHAPSTPRLAVAAPQQALASLLATLVEYTQQEELP